MNNHITDMKYGCLRAIQSFWSTNEKKYIGTYLYIYLSLKEQFSVFLEDAFRQVKHFV